MAVRETTQPVQPVSSAIALPSNIPQLPPEVIVRFPGVQEYQDKMDSWWKKIRSTLANTTDSLATASNESKAVEADLETSISEITKTFTGDFSAAMAAITTETTIRATADGSLASSITTLSTAYQAADATLTASVVSETTARTSADGALSTSITALTTAYLAADTVIRASVVTETNARSSADGALSTSITTLTTAYQAADTTIAASVSAETTARSSADGALSTSITNLTTAYLAADVALGARVTTETTARTNADTSLASSITSLTTAYQNADTALQSNITSEATARTSADGALSTRAATLESQVQTAGTGLLARVGVVESTYATQTYAVAQASSALTAAIGDATARVLTESSARAAADGNLASKWTLQVAAGNVIVGMNLSAVSSPGGDYGTFIVSAPIFKIYNTATSDGVAPFSVIGGAVYIEDAFIKNVAVSKLLAGTINVAVELTAATFSAGKMATGATRFNVANYAKEMPFVSYCMANLVAELGAPISPANTSTSGTYFTSTYLQMPGWGSGADGVLTNRFGQTNTFFQATLDGSCNITGRMGYDLCYNINGGAWNNFSAHHVARDSAFENISLVTSVLLTGLAGTDVVQFGVKIDHSSGATGPGMGELYLSVMALNG
jgi:hypothetical protein